MISYFDIEDVFSFSFWKEILDTEGEPTRSGYNISHKIDGILNFLSSFLALLASGRPDYDDVTLLADHQGSIRIYLPEDPGETSSLSRATTALSSIHLLYDVVCQASGHEHNPLALLACDSGSDKSFDLLGLAECMTELRALIIDIWDLVVHHRERKAERNLDLIVKSLPLMITIKDLEESESLSREQAELMRRKLVSGVTGFIDAGVITHDIYHNSTHDPRQLMKPAQGLLPRLADSSYSDERRHEEINTAIDSDLAQDVNTLTEAQKRRIIEIMSE